MPDSTIHTYASEPATPNLGALNKRSHRQTMARGPISSCRQYGSRGVSTAVNVCRQDNGGSILPHPVHNVEHAADALPPARQQLGLINTRCARKNCGRKGAGAQGPCRKTAVLDFREKLPAPSRLPPTLRPLPSWRGAGAAWGPHQPRPHLPLQAHHLLLLKRLRQVPCADGPASGRGQPSRRRP